MLKVLKIEVRIADDKLATAIQDQGFDQNSISSQLEILGIVENIKGIIQERIKNINFKG